MEFKGAIVMKRVFILLIALILAFSLIGCSKHSNETVFDVIKFSPVAKIELPDGSSAYVDSEIDSIRSFADLELMEASLKPADAEIYNKMTPFFLFFWIMVFPLSITGQNYICRVTKSDRI